MKGRAKPAPRAHLIDSDAVAVAVAGTRLGRLAAGSAPGALLVEHEGSGPLPARSTVALDRAAVERAVATGQPAVLLFENGDARLPIVVGLVQPTQGEALLSALLDPASTPAPLPALSPAPLAKPVTEARVDGRRVLLEGRDEVSLRCGEASITLRRDGKLILRGAYVETTARGVNRIRGGSVKIN